MAELWTYKIQENITQEDQAEKDLSLEEKYERLEAQNKLLKAENELLKKLEMIERR